MNAEYINSLKELFAAITPIIGLLLAYLSGTTIKLGKDGKEFQIFSTLPDYVRLLFVCGFIYCGAGAVTGWLGFIASQNNFTTRDIWATTNLVWVVANTLIGILILLFALRTSIAKSDV